MSSLVFKVDIFIIAFRLLFSPTAFSPSQFLILRNLGVTVKPFPPPTIRNHTTPFYDVNCTRRPAYYKHYHHITIGRRRAWHTSQEQQAVTPYINTILCHSRSYNNIPQHIIPHHTIVYHTIPYHTPAFPITPQHTIGTRRPPPTLRTISTSTGSHWDNNLLIISFPIIVRVINAWPEMFQSHVFTRKIADVAYTSWH